MRLLYPILFCLLLSCSVNTGHPTSNIKNKFDSLISIMPLRNLPVDFICGLPDGAGADNMLVSDLSAYENFTPKNQKVLFGILERTKNYTAVIYGESGDDIYPTLFIYDTLGNRIDSLSLILSGCGGADESSIPVSTVHIDQSLNILLTDTIQFIHYPDSHSKFIVDSIKISVVRYHVDKTGIIVKD